MYTYIYICVYIHIYTHIYMYTYILHMGGKRESFGLSTTLSPVITTKHQICECCSRAAVNSKTWSLPSCTYTLVEKINMYISNHNLRDT